MSDLHINLIQLGAALKAIETTIQERPIQGFATIDLDNDRTLTVGWKAGVVEKIEIELARKEPKPTVGRIVHYHVGYEHLLNETDGQGNRRTEMRTKPYAAIVVAVSEKGTGNVNLKALHPDGDETFELAVPFSQTPKPGHWSWPPRV